MTRGDDYAAFVEEGLRDKGLPPIPRDVMAAMARGFDLDGEKSKEGAKALNDWYRSIRPKESTTHV